MAYAEKAGSRLPVSVDRVGRLELIALDGKPHSPGPTEVYYGAGSIGGLPDLCEKAGVRKMLLVCGKRHASSSGLLGKIQGLLGNAAVSCEIFGDVCPDPGSDVVDAAVDRLMAKKCDGVIGVGGGSAMDVAKFIAMLATNGGACAEYEASRTILYPPLPVIAIPTTAGSGSEVTPYSVVGNIATGRKFTVTHDSLRPRFAIVDPELTLSLPRETTRAAGLDAWVHSLEAYLSRQSQPLADSWAQRVLETIPRNIGPALSRPRDLRARSNMTLAALVSGLVISQVRTGMVHTMSVALSPHARLPHGLLNAIITPYVLRYNSGAYESRLTEVANRLGDGISSCDADAEGRIGDWLRRLGVPRGLAFARLERSLIPGLVKRVQQDSGLGSVNARPFDGKALASIFAEILAH